MSTEHTDLETGRSYYEHTPEERANFVKLADFLKLNHKTMKAAGAFQMSDYIDDESAEDADWSHAGQADIEQIAEGACGASACAVGWATVAVRPIARDEDDEFDWHEYCLDLFGVDEAAPAWEYLFGPNNPDSAKKAAARINAYLGDSQVIYKPTIRP